MNDVYQLIGRDSHRMCVHEGSGIRFTE